MKKLPDKEKIKRLRSAVRRRFLGLAPHTCVHKDRKKEHTRTLCRKQTEEP